MRNILHIRDNFDNYQVREASINVNSVFEQTNSYFSAPWMTNLRTDEMVNFNKLTKIGTDENKAIYSIQKKFKNSYQSKSFKRIFKTRKFFICLNIWIYLKENSTFSSFILEVPIFLTLFNP